MHPLEPMPVWDRLMAACTANGAVSRRFGSNGTHQFECGLYAVWDAPAEGDIEALFRAAGLRRNYGRSIAGVRRLSIIGVGGTLWIIRAQLFGSTDKVVEALATDKAFATTVVMFADALCDELLEA